MNPETDTIAAPVPTEEAANVNAILAKLNAPPVEHVVEPATPISETVSAPIAEIVTAPAAPETQAASSAAVTEAPVPAPVSTGVASPAAPVIEAKRVFVSFLFPNAPEFTKKQVAEVNAGMEYIAASSLVNALVASGEIKLVRKQPQAGRGKPTDIFSLVPKETKSKKKK